MLFIHKGSVCAKTEATNGGSSFSTGSEYSTAAGGFYRLCWCSSGFDCQLPQHFQVDAGLLSIIGPAPQYQDRTCISGQPCYASDLTGLDLGNDDRIMVLETCGSFSAPLRFTGGGVSDLATENGTRVNWGREPTCMQPYNFDCQGCKTDESRWKLQAVLVCPQLHMCCCKATSALIWDTWHSLVLIP